MTARRTLSWRLGLMDGRRWTPWTRRSRTVTATELVSTAMGRSCATRTATYVGGSEATHLPIYCADWPLDAERRDGAERRRPGRAPGLRAPHAAPRRTRATGWVGTQRSNLVLTVDAASPVLVLANERDLTTPPDGTREMAAQHLRVTLRARRRGRSRRLRQRQRLRGRDRRRLPRRGSRRATGRLPAAAERLRHRPRRGECPADVVRGYAGWPVRQSVETRTTILPAVWPSALSRKASASCSSGKVWATGTDSAPPSMSLVRWASASPSGRTQT